MIWLGHHRESERHAADAELCIHRGDHARAKELYGLAADAEKQALSELKSSEKPRTHSIISVSAVALYYKAWRLCDAERLAKKCLENGDLLDFAARQVSHLLESIDRRRRAT